MRGKRHGKKMSSNGGVSTALKNSVEESGKSDVIKKVSWLAVATAAAQLTLDVIRVIRGFDDFRRKVKPE